MLYGVIELVGKLLQHVLGVLLLCWQRMLRFGLSVGILSFLMAEVVGSALTRQFPPTILTTVVALIVSFALGYAAALTALADELFLSALDTVRMLEGDARAGLRAATVVAEREAGEARQGLLGWLGHPPAKSSPVGAAGTVAAGIALAARHARSTPSLSPEQAETLEAIAATDSFQSTAPRPRVNARPVRADQLPRIPWAYDQAADTASPSSGAAPAAAEEPDAVPVPDMPPLPLRVPDAAPLAAPELAEAESDQPAASLADDPAATWPATRKPAPSIPASPAYDPAPAPVAAVSATETPTEPTPSESGVDPNNSSGDRSIWARIGQALVGNTMPLAALGGTHTLGPANPRPGTSTESTESASADSTSTDPSSSGDQPSQTPSTDQP